MTELTNACPKCGIQKKVAFELCYKCAHIGEPGGLAGVNRKRWGDPGNQNYRRWFAKINAPLCRSAANVQIEELADEFPEFDTCRCKDCVDRDAPRPGA